MLFFPFPEQLKAYLGYNIDTCSLMRIIKLPKEMICHCDVTLCNIRPGSVRVFSRKVEKFLRIVVKHLIGAFEILN